jgi:hypothetical protein
LIHYPQSAGNVFGAIAAFATSLPENRVDSEEAKMLFVAGSGRDVLCVPGHARIGGIAKRAPKDHIPRSIEP